MKKLKNIAYHYYTRLIPKEGDKHTVRYQCDLPLTVGDEKNLKILMEKYGLESCFQIHEEEVPPVRRVLTKEVEYTELSVIDDFSTKLDKALRSSNFRMPRCTGSDARALTCDVISESNTLLQELSTGYYTDVIFIEGKFSRAENYTPSIHELINEGRAYHLPTSSTQIKLIKDSRDPENIWTIQYYLYSLGNTTTKAKEDCSKRFIEGSKRYLNATDIKWVLKLI